VSTFKLGSRRFHATINGRSWPIRLSTATSSSICEGILAFQGRSKLPSRQRITVQASNFEMSMPAVAAPSGDAASTRSTKTS
jgi:hypothetical protein